MIVFTSLAKDFNMCIMLPTKYVCASCIFRDLENDYQVSMWTLLTYSEQNLGQDSTYTGSHILPI